MATIEEHMEQQKLVQVSRRRPARPSPSSVDEEDGIDSEDEDEDEEELLELNLPKPPPQPLPPPRYAAPPPAPPPLKKIETLEDLYHFFPNVGDGSFYLRVERVQPKSHQGYPVAGFLGDYHERMTLPEFQDRFGGGKYTVYVMGPVKSRDDGAPVPIRALTSVDLQIPGMPSMAVQPQQFGDEYMMNMPRGIPYGEPKEVAVKRLDIEARQHERAEEDRRRLMEQVHMNQNAPEHVVKALSDQSDKAITEIKSQAELSVTLLREQQKAMFIELGKKEDELRELRTELVKAKTDASESNRKFEQDLRQTLFAQHQAEIVTLKDQFSREIGQLRDTHKRETEQLEKINKERMDAESRRYGEDLTRRDVDARNERERITRESERSEKSLRDTYEARISDLTRATERELASIREQRDRELSSIRETHKSTESFTKQTGEVQITALNNEITRLRTDNESLKRENDGLRKESHKPPEVFLSDVEKYATSLLGMVKPGDMEKETDEQPGDWKTAIGKGLVGLMQKAPEIAEKVSETVMQRREQGRMMAAQQAAQQQAMMEAAQQQQNPRGLPGLPGPAPGGRRRQVAPTPWSGNVHSPIAPEIQFRPPVPQRIIVQTQAQADAIINGTAGDHLAEQQPPAAQPPAPQAVEQQPAQQVVQPQPQPSQFAQASQQEQEIAFIKFVDELNDAIKGEIIPPAMFASGLIARVGKDQASVLLQQVPVNKFLELVQQQDDGRGAAIATRVGRQYVREMWEECARLVAGG